MSLCTCECARNLFVCLFFYVRTIVLSKIGQHQIRLRFWCAFAESVYADRTRATVNQQQIQQANESGRSNVVFESELFAVILQNDQQFREVFQVAFPRQHTQAPNKMDLVRQFINFLANCFRCKEDAVHQVCMFEYAALIMFVGL